MAKYRKGHENEAAPAPAAVAASAIRLDKWLWQARFFKSRSLAAAAVEAGPMRLNGNPVTRPAQPLKPGDVVTFFQGNRIRAVRLRDPGTRRGPASEAAGLYDDLDAPGLDASAASSE